MKHSALALAFVFAAAPAGAQWLDYPTAGIPRTADGKPNLSAPAPRAADGRPDISGLWRPPTPPMINNIARDLKEPVPFQPAAEQLYKQRLANNAKDDPGARCIVEGVPRANIVPYPFKIFQLQGVTVILYEAIHSYRQIFSDGRELPTDPDPAWYGYSIGRWDGDAFVVQTTGFHDGGWLDASGRPATDALRVTERFRRRDFGHMDIEITIDDPKAYTKPWTVNVPLTLVPDSDLLEFMCNENNKYSELVK